MDELEAGATIGHRYEPRRVIARGGTYVILAAEHRFTGRRLAIKRLDLPWIHHEGARARLLREARALETARHPNVVDVLDAGIDDDDQPFLVMEQLVGRTLGGLLTSRQTLAQEEVIHIGLEVCAALGAAHARGVVHRDVKPSNVMLVRGASDELNIKLIDFGMAGMPTDSTPEGSSSTEPAEALGAPQYKAPELLRADGLPAPCVDVYSLGVVLYECLTSKVPHEGDLEAVLAKLTSVETQHVRALRHDVSQALNDVVMRAVAKAPKDRYPDMASLAQGLREAVEHIGPDADAGRPKLATTALPGLPSIPVLPTQRRRFERQAYVTLVRIVQDDGLVLDGRSEDISEGGMLVVTERACTNAMKANIRFALPMSGRIVGVPASLRWVRTGRGKVAAGLQFEDLDAEARIEIGRYVALMAKTAARE